MKTWQKIITVISILLMFVPRFLPPLPGLNTTGTVTLGIFIGTLLLLACVSLNWPVFLCLFAVAFNGLYSFNTALSMMFGNWIMWFVIINGIVFSSVEKTGLFRRVALWISCRPVTKKNPWLFIFFFLLAAMVCGSLMNTTAAYLLFLALSAEVLEQIGVKKGTSFAAVFMICVMAVSNISHAVTPFGHSITVMSINYFSEFGGLDFLRYSVMGYVCGIIGLVLMILLMKWIFRPDMTPFRDFDPTDLIKEKKPLNHREKFGGVIVLCVILFWLSPTFLQGINQTAYSFVNSSLGLLSPLALAIVLLCLIPVDGEPIMDLGVSLKNAPWSAGLATGISMFLGSVLQNEEAEIVPTVCALLEPVCAGLSPVVVVMLISLLIMVMSNFTSCTLSVMLGGIITSTLMAGGALTGVHPGGLSVAFALSAQAAFATPPASAPAAILSGEGWATSGQQLRQGFLYAFGWWLVAIAGYGITSLIF